MGKENKCVTVIISVFNRRTKQLNKSRVKSFEKI